MLTASLLSLRGDPSAQNKYNFFMVWHGMLMKTRKKVVVYESTKTEQSLTQFQLHLVYLRSSKIMTIELSFCPHSHLRKQTPSNLPKTFKRHVRGQLGTVYRVNRKLDKKSTFTI